MLKVFYILKQTKKTRMEQKKPKNKQVASDRT